MKWIEKWTKKKKKEEDVCGVGVFGIDVSCSVFGNTSWWNKTWNEPVFLDN